MITDEEWSAGGHVVCTRHTYTDAEPRALAPWQLESTAIKALSEEFQAGWYSTSSATAPSRATPATSTSGFTRW